MTVTQPGAAAAAFDTAAASFDDRFGGWRSVAAQRAAVRVALLAAFPAGARVLELGGGNGADAAWLAEHGRDPVHTDPAPRMVALARQRLNGKVAESPQVLAAEDLEAFARRRTLAGEPPFDGAYSNFAALNCVLDLRPVARGLAQLLRPGAPALLVLFGTLPPGEVLVQLARGDVRATVRRLARGPVTARLCGQSFRIRYHRAREIRAAFGPWFRPGPRHGIGVFVPPSAAEPWISRRPRLLRALAALDRVASRPLAALGDHVLYHFVRTSAAVEA